MPTTTPFNNLITFSRGSNATVTGPNGLIQWAPNNLLTFSEQFDNAAWTKLNATVTANTAVAPDGTTTADTLTTSGTAAAQRVGQNPTNTGVSTFSIYVKAGTAQFVQLIHSSDGNAYANFDVGSGTLGTRGTGSSSTITDVGNGWYRCTLTFNIASSTFWYAYIVPSASAAYGASFTATVANVLLWGAQLELGSTATTYNPTTVKNLLGFSEAFDNAAWTKANASIVTGAQANPINGLFNAQKLMEDTVAAVPHGFASANVTTIVGTPMTSAFYAKAAGRSWIVANAFNAANKRCWFDLANGTTGTTAAGCTTSITSVGNGWYRCAVIQTAAATTMSLGLYAATADGVLSYTGDGNSGAYIYGALLSDSASLDPYVPTPGAAPSSTAFYGPRFDYDPVTLLPRGLLMEEQRTNLLVRSEELENASWDKTASVTANQLVSPGGSTTGDLVSTTANFQYTRQLITATANAQYTATFFVKPVTGSTTIRILLTNAPQTEYAGSNFGLTGDGSLGTTFTTGTGVLVGRSITKLADGWYRCSVTATNNTTSLYSLIDNHAGGTMSFGVWGAQLEAGAFATSYIPTVASTVTRSADVATITGQNFAQWYRQDEGSFVFEGSSFGIGSNTPNFLIASNGSAGEYVRMNGASGYTNRLLVQAGGVQSANINVGSGLISETPAKAAGAYAVNSFQAAANAVLGVADTSGAVPAGVNQILFGSFLASAGTYLNGHIRNIRFIPARAADFQLQALST